MDLLSKQVRRCGVSFEQPSLAGSSCCCRRVLPRQALAVCAVHAPARTCSSRVRAHRSTCAAHALGRPAACVAGSRQREALVAAAHGGPGGSSSSYSGGSPSRYDAPGPYQPQTLPLLTQAVGMSPSGAQLDIQVEVVVPQGVRGAPLVLFTPGFLLNSALYRATASRLASWGWAVGLWDLNEVLDDTLTTVYMSEAIELVGRRCAGVVDTGRLVLAGHSRGAKLSARLAAQEPRCCGLVLLDPVDRADVPLGPGYPSALPDLTAATRSRYLPTLVVGAAANGDIIPADANWKHFVAAAARGGASPVWEVVLAEAGHLQFLDKQLGLFSLFSGGGALSDELVRRLSQWAAVAWLQAVVAPGPGGSHGAGRAALLEQVGGAMGRLAAVTSKFSHLDLLQRGQHGAPSQQPTPQQQQQQQRATSAAGASSSQSGWEAYTSSQAGSSGWKQPSAASSAGSASVPSSYEQLMGMRVRDLKAMLAERGVDGSDCFEKSDLVRKLLAVGAGRAAG